MVAQAGTEGGEPATLERVLRHERAVTVAGLVLLCALAWLYVLAGAGMGMSPWRMTTLSLFPHGAAEDAAAMTMADAGPPAWSLGLWTLTVAMWWVMMIAMMTPSATPTILLYGRTHRHARARGQVAGPTPTWAFAAGYLLVWLGFSLVATELYWGLERVDLVSAATMGSGSRWLSGAVLTAAGLYQLSPLQQTCLSHCRSPAAFLSRHWRPGASGAIRLGVLHGAYCVGCCGMLMALLFVGGAMNLAWIAALTLLVMTETVLPGGPWIARICGVAMLAWAAATVLI
jgi:predicted metal-binding membrane protein